MNKEKHVDESWKEQAEAEKVVTDKPADQSAPDQSAEQALNAENTQEQAQAVEVNFLNYITSLGFQAMIFMGEIPNPVTNETEKNLNQAKFLIDTLDMLKEKTEGNLNDQERDFLKNSVYELQMRFVQASQADQSTDGKQA